MICIWSSHCHQSSLASLKSRMVLPFWCRLTQVAVEKRPLNGCSSSNKVKPVSRSVIVKVVKKVDFGVNNVTHNLLVRFPRLC